MLWNDTGTTFKIIDNELKKVHKTANDVLKSSNGKTMKPIFTTLTRKGHKLLSCGSTSDGLEMVYYEDGIGVAGSKMLSSEGTLDNVKTITAGEMSYDQKYVYFGGESKSNKPLLCSVKLSKSLKVLNSQEIEDSSVTGQVNSIRRIDGTDVLIVGCRTGIFVVTFKDKSEFAVLFKYSTDFSVGRISFWGYRMVLTEASESSVGKEGNKIKILNYKQDIDQANFIQKENKWRGGCTVLV